MIQTLFLMRHEVSLMWKEFKYSLKRSLTMILVLLVVAVVIIVFATLETVLSALFNVYPAVLQDLIHSMIDAGLTASKIGDILYLVLTMFFVASLIRGFFTSSFGWLFTRVDENVVNPSPTAPHALYGGKKFKRFLTHALMVATLLFTILPLIGRIGFGGIQIIALFIALLAFIEIYGFIENIAYCLVRMLKTPRHLIRALGSVSTIILVVFAAAVPFLVILGGDVFAFLTYLYPPYVLSRIVALTSSLGVSSGTIILVIEATLFALAASASAKFGLRRWSSSPRLVQTRGGYIRFRKDKVMWKAGSKNDVNLIFMKDFWVTIRNPAKFVVPLAITLILLVFVLQFQLMFLGPGKPISAQFADPVFILATYLISVLVLPPAWDSFAGERRTLFILKTAPISPDALVNGKYLFALMKSAIYIAPIIVALSFLLPHSWNITFIVLEVTLVLLVSNAVGILASVSYPPAYRGVGPPPFLVVLGLPFLCAVLTVVIPISLILSYGNSILFAELSIPVLIYVFVVLRLCLKKAVGSFIKLQES